MGELVIRHETEDDYQEAESLIRLAFWNVYRPGCFEHYLVHELRDDQDYLSDLSFVAERNGYLEGALYASKAYLDEGLRHEVATFGPIGVDPSFQREGVGTALVNAFLEEARSKGVEAVVLVGSPAFYKRFGFVPASKYGILMDDNSSNPALQALELKKGALDGYAGASFHNCPCLECRPDPYDLHEFDKQFPHLDKEVRPGQID